MKITANQLRRIIREEVQRVILEAGVSPDQLKKAAQDYVSFCASDEGKSGEARAEWIVRNKDMMFEMIDQATEDQIEEWGNDYPAMRDESRRTQLAKSLGDKEGLIKNPKRNSVLYVLAKIVSGA